MNVLILTIGSRGDVQPYVALGKGLSAAGHVVTVCANVRFKSFIEEHGLAYAYLNDDLVSLLDTDVGRAAVEDLGNMFKGIRTAVRLVKKTGPIMQALIREGWEAAEAVNPDIMLYHTKMGSAVHYAEKLNTPVVHASLFPQFVPTAAFPTIGFPTLKLGGWYNLFTYRLVLKIASKIGAKYIQEWRSSQDLPRQPRGTDILHKSDGTRIPVLHACSNKVIAEPTDWPEGVVNTGYWFMDRPTDWEPPIALEQFLASGAPPVYVGFGSMAGRKPERVTRIVIDALQRADLRGVLASGWGGLAPGELPDTILKIDKVPHDWLFPQTLAVVHHGGAGTTAAGLRAGRPTIICPFFGDQPFWGRRMHELGVGTAPIPQKKLTVEKLVAALTEVTENPSISEKASFLGKQIRGEDGIGVTIAFVERVYDLARA